MKSLSQFSVKCFSVVELAHSEVTVKNGKVKKMLFVITIWVLCKKGGPLNLLT